MKRLLLTVRDIVVILLLALLAMMIGGIWLDSWEVNKIILPLHYLFAPAIYLLVFLLGFRFLKKKLYHDDFHSAFFPPVFHGRYFACAGGVLVLCWIGTALTGGRFVFPKMNEYHFWQNAATIVGVTFLTPFVEEIAFRIVILKQISKRYGIMPGIIISSLLFGAVHLMNGRLDAESAIQLIVSGTLMGALLGIVCVSEKSVWASYTIHALYNGVTSILPVDIKVGDDWPVCFVLKTDNQLISGGEYGIDCSLMNITAYVIMILLVLALLHRKGVFLRDIDVESL